MIKDSGAKTPKGLLRKRASITVGIHGEEGSETHRAEFAEDGALTPSRALTVAEVGAFHEFGHPNFPEPGTYPPRPFIRGWFDDNVESNRALLLSQFKLVAAGKLTIEQALERCALKMEAGVKGRISKRGNGAYPENAKSTIARKGSSVPLINTGQLRNSIRAKAEIIG